MTKLSRKTSKNPNMGYYINNLWSVFTLADSKGDIKLLVKDLFTHTEYKMLAKRLEVFRRLIAGQTYEIIRKEVSMTDATISKISNILIERGTGVRKAVVNLDKLEARLLQKQKAYQQELENPLLKKIRNRHKAVLGEILKIGIKKLDEKVMKVQKQNTAKKTLAID